MASGAGAADVPPAPAGRRPGIRQRLVVIALVVAVPLLLLSAAAVWKLGEDERKAQRQAIVYSARAIQSAVDAQMNLYVATVTAFANGTALRHDDIAAFRESAAILLRDLTTGWAISLIDANGRKLFSSRFSNGEPGPPTSSTGLTLIEQAAKTKQVQISDLYIGPVKGAPIVSLVAPVFRDDAIRYFVILSVSPEVFFTLLNRQGVPEGWQVGIVDRGGNFVTRSTDHQRFVATPAPAGWRSVLGRGGWFEFSSVEGDALEQYNVVSPLTGWDIGFAARKDIIEAPIRSTLVWSGLIGGAVTLSSALLAFLAAQGIIKPIKALEEGVERLKRREAIQPRRTGVSEVDRVLAAFHDAATAIIEQQEELARVSNSLWATVETASDAIIVIDAVGAVQSANPAVERIFGYRPEELAGRNISLLMPEPEAAGHCDHIRDYLRTGVGKVVGIGREVEGRRKDGTLFPADLAIAEWRMAGERYFTGIMRDITERKRAEEHVQFVMRELSHRTKNVLAVVQAMAWQIARKSVDLADFQDGFASRIDALARAHDLLTAREWQGVSLPALVEGQLQHFGAAEQIEVSGPDLMVKPAAVQSLGLLLHELATNAIKHGALSRPSGKIDIGWGLEAVDDAPLRLRMNWREHGGPPVAPPAHKGFGLVVIKEMTERALKAQVIIDFNPAGLVWQIVAPADACLQDLPDLVM
jgi:PAS domain S-box-containing protein